MNLRHLPNLLCVLRILLVYPVAVGILRGHYAEVLALLALAAFTDALDGSLAKRFNWTSELGKVLDPVADKLMLVTVFVCLSVAGIAPWWLTALVLLRDLVILLGALTYKRLFGPLRGAPTAVSKLNTFCQILFGLAAVASAAFEVARRGRAHGARGPGLRDDRRERPRLRVDLTPVARRRCRVRAPRRRPEHSIASSATSRLARS